MQLLSEGSWWEGRGTHKLKQHSAHARRNVKPCLKVLDDLRAKMLGHLESYQANKAKT